MNFINLELLGVGDFIYWVKRVIEINFWIPIVGQGVSHLPVQEQRKFCIEGALLLVKFAVYNNIQLMELLIQDETKHI